MIGEPGYGKYLVDGINASDKRYWKGKMCMIGIPEEDDYSKRIKTHSMTGNAHYIFQKSANIYVNVVIERME